MRWNSYLFEGMGESSRIANTLVAEIYSKRRHLGSAPISRLAAMTEVVCQ